MAIKQTTTLNVIIGDNNGGTTTFKIDDPDGSVNLAQVKSAFGYFFDNNEGRGNILCNSSGYDYTSVQRAETVTTTISTEVLE